MVKLLGAIRDQGKTVFVVTHQAALLEQTADEFIWMQAGQIVSPPPDSFFTRLGHAVVTGETPSASQAAANAVLQWVTEHTGLELMPMTWAFDGWDQ